MKEKSTLSVTFKIIGAIVVVGVLVAGAVVIWKKLSAKKKAENCDCICNCDCDDLCECECECNCDDFDFGEEDVPGAE